MIFASLIVLSRWAITSTVRPAGSEHIYVHVPKNICALFPLLTHVYNYAQDKQSHNDSYEFNNLLNSHDVLKFSITDFQKS